MRVGVSVRFAYEEVNALVEFDLLQIPSIALQRHQQPPVAHKHLPTPHSAHSTHQHRTQ